MELVNWNVFSPDFKLFLYISNKLSIIYLYSKNLFIFFIKKSLNDIIDNLANTIKSTVFFNKIWLEFIKINKVVISSSIIKDKISQFTLKTISIIIKIINHNDHNSNKIC